MIPEYIFQDFMSGILSDENEDERQICGLI